MSLEVTREGDSLVVVRLEGRLDFNSMATHFGAARQQEGGVNSLRVLVFLQGFEGWIDSEHWGDTSAIDRNDAFIDRIAVIGDERWRHGMELFLGKGLRKASVEYFLPEEEAAARFWLDSQ